ncbi:MAG: hypothetical protein KF821_01165 [Anaerolineales bacterium]|nr:hypothetical protein [Anaerolineales bacterium]MBX3004419.1 hypothetical protein [Anaerolineales bacterium]MCW5838352.1 hypothetical protein [Anaerolineales bacterium]
MKNCPFCAEEIQDAAIVCKHCGRDLPAPLAEETQIVDTKDRTVPKKGLPRWRKIAIGFVLLSAMCMCLFVISQSGENEQDQEAKNAQIVAPSLTPSLEPSSTPVDRNLSILMDVVGLSEEEASDAFEAIKSVGFDRISSLEFVMDRDGLLAYSADFGYTNSFSVTFWQNKVFGISNVNTVFYDADAGGPLDNIKNYTLDITEQATFMYLTEQYVKQALRSPSTAEFPSGLFAIDQWGFGRKRDVVTVQSYVDAQNGFGAMIRSNFTAQFSYSTEALLYLEIDGQAVYGSPQH